MHHDAVGTVDVSRRGRILFIDNLRVTMILLVVVFHSAVTYGPIGDWMYQDHRGASDTSDMIFLVLIVFSQAFFMGLLFLLAGYFAPGSLQRRGVWTFLRERARRLIAPALLFILVIFPPTNYMVNRGYFHDHGVSLLEYWTRYAPDVASWDTGPLWFTLALFLFTGAWMLSLTIHRKHPQEQIARLRQRDLVLMVLITGAATFAVRVFLPLGTEVWNMQLCFFPQYIALFTFGILAFKNGWLGDIDRRLARPWRVLLVFLAVLAFPTLLVVGGALEGDLSSFEGGPHWQSLALSMWGEGFAVAMCVVLVDVYRRRFDGQGRATRFLSRNAFSVYVFHAPILVILAMSLGEVEVNVLLKFIALAISGISLTYLVSGFLLRRLPLVNGIV